MKSDKATDRSEQALAQLATIKRDAYERTGHKNLNLGDVLKWYGGASEELRWEYADPEKEKFRYWIGEQAFEVPVFYDALSGERTAFLQLPLSHIHHDALINPRGINLALENLIKEFGSGNPQLQQCLARLDGNAVRIFDGQHKTVSRILLGEREVLLRLFIETPPAKLMETNVRAGSELKQIEFDAGMQRHLSTALMQVRIKQYQEEHGLSEDDTSFLTDELIREFLGL